MWKYFDWNRYVSNPWREAIEGIENDKTGAVEVCFQSLEGGY